MKHLLKISLLALCISFASCKKYEDGPPFSLMTKKARISNIWAVDKYYLNGVDKTIEYRQLIVREKLVFFQSGNFEYNELSNWSWAVPSYSGKWALINNKENLEMIPDNSAVSTKTFRILRLKNKELWLEQTFKPDSIAEYHYLPQTVQ